MSSLSSLSVYSTCVVIVGGGVGGLAAGVALRQGGIECMIFERDENLDARSHGYGMTLSSDERGPLGALGILEECRAADCLSREHWTFDGNGFVRGYFGRGLLRGKKDSSASERGGSLRVKRQELRRFLLERYEELGGTILWNAPLETIEVDAHLGATAAQEGDEAVLCATFNNGRVVARGVALVGADGLRSRVRALVDDKDDDLRSLGVGAIVGLSTFRHPLVEGRGFYVVDGEARLFTMPFDADQTMWQLSFPTKGDADLSLDKKEPARALKRARTQVGAWKDSIRLLTLGLIDETPPEDLWASKLFDRYDKAEKSLFSRRPPPFAGRVTLLGDAAHPMTCFKGQGANSALADAKTLATCLKHLNKANTSASSRQQRARKKQSSSSSSSSSSSIIAKRLRAFEREMLQRANPRVLASREAAATLHSPKALETLTFDGFDGDPFDLANLLRERKVDASLTPDELLAALKAAVASLSDSSHPRKKTI